MVQSLMLKFALQVAILLVALLIYAPAWSQQPETVDIGPATANLIAWLAPIIIIVVVAVAGWLIARLAKLLGLEVNALQRAVVDHGLERAIGFAITKVGDKARRGIPIRVKNEAIAVASDYALRSIPGALKHFEKTRDDLAEMIEARLEKVLIEQEEPASAVRPAVAPFGGG